MPPTWPTGRRVAGRRPARSRRPRASTSRASASRQAGTVAVAGVAWAQHTGISKVEVQVDGGAWQPARLAEAVTADTWIQWVYEWDDLEL